MQISVANAVKYLKDIKASMSLVDKLITDLFVVAIQPVLKSCQLHNQHVARFLSGFRGAEI
jgi:hypothetical protein